MLALAMTGVAALAVVLAIRRHTWGLKAVQHKTDLLTWENEGGSPGAPPSENRRSILKHRPAKSRR